MTTSEFAESSPPMWPPHETVEPTDSRWVSTMAVAMASMIQGQCRFVDYADGAVCGGGYGNPEGGAELARVPCGGG